MAKRAASIPRLGYETSRQWQLLFYLVLVAWAIALVYAHSSGRIATGRAVLLLPFPIAAIGVALRPGWVVLFVAAAPVAQIQIAPTRGLALLLLVTLAGQVVMRGSISVGWRSGFLGLVLLFAAALLFRTDLSGTNALIARGFLNSLAFSILLGLVSYNATRLGDLSGKSLVNALLFGLMLSVILEHTVFADGGGVLGPDARPIGRPISYLAAVGFALCFARLVVRTEDGDYYHRIVHFGLAAGFLLALLPGLQRGAWLSALLAVLFISLWAGKKRYLLILIPALMVMLTVPVARERIVPSEQLSSGGGYTTGRWDLWSRLWNEVEPALPLGNGFGHSFTLTSEELFGPGVTSFTPEGSTAFVYPHNDFLFWMVELGLLGLLGMVLFWSQLLQAIRSVSRSTSANKINVQVLSGVVITAFVIQLVGSTFFFAALANAFFIVAGFVFGAREAAADERSSVGVDVS